LKGFSDFATDGEVNMIVSLSTFLNNTEKNIGLYGWPAMFG
jgi:hypothetical protein